MDSRNIKEPTPQIEDGKHLEKIYDLQKELLDSYIKIEGLPSYPIDVNSKKSQIILKDFTGRVIEELGEGYESMLKVFNKRLDYIKDMDNKETFLYIKAEAQNLNEELADALHFFMELLIYTNIHPEDIYQYCKTTAKNLRIPLYDCCCLSQVLTFSRNMVMGSEIDLPNKTLIRIAHEEDECIPVGWETSEDFVRRCAIQLWDVTYSLSIARNCLKNKPWKQSGELTDENLYQNLLCESFVKLCGFYALMGYTDKTLFAVYFKKNMVNKFRIASRY